MRAFFCRSLSRWSQRPIYFDYQATSQVDPRVLDAMLPFFSQKFGNPHSTSHHFGWEAEHHTEMARQHVADLIGANSAKDIIFTSGATESNNLALKGVVDQSKSKKIHIITTQIEHKCVLSSCRTLSNLPHVEVTYLPVTSRGVLDVQAFREAIRPGETLLASVMLVNNEIGTIQPVEEIGKLCKEFGITFHCDAAQAVGKLPVDVDKIQCDLLSMSGHKFYGPKGVGALYVRRKPKRVRLRPQIDGGGQERGLRSGTLAPALVVGLGRAAQLASQEMEYDSRRSGRLYAKLYQGITQALPQVFLNGSQEPGEFLTTNLNLSFQGVEGESLLMALGGGSHAESLGQQPDEDLRKIAISSGSACTSASLEPSYVLRALGIDEELAHTSLRLGIGRFTTEEEVDFAISSLTANVQKLREMSPCWGEDMSNVTWG